MKRFFLDYKISFTFRRIARRAGGIAVGFLASEPIQVVEDDDSHWWVERLTVFLLFWSVNLYYHERIVPHSPTQVFK